MLGACWVIQHIGRCPVGPLRRTNQHPTTEAEGHGTVNGHSVAVWMLIIMQEIAVFPRTWHGGRDG